MTVTAYFNILVLIFILEVSGLSQTFRLKRFSVGKTKEFIKSIHASHQEDLVPPITMFQSQKDDNLADDLPSGLLTHSLLSKAEEAKLVRQYKLSKSITAQRAAMTKEMGREVASEEVAAALGLGTDQAEYLVGVGLSARELMVSCNMRLVSSVAKSYTGFGLSFADLVLMGVEGLCTAVEKFDPDRGFRFSTHAGWWIRQRLSRAVASKGRMMRIPEHLHQVLVKVQMAQRVFEAKHHRLPTEMELAAVLSIPVDTIERVLSMNTEENSADEELFRGSGDPGDAVMTSSHGMETDSKPPADWAAERANGDNFYLDLDQLTEREALVHALRSGMTQEKKSLDEIGAILGVTRERVRVISGNVVRKLKTLEAETWRTQASQYTTGVSTVAVVEHGTPALAEGAKKKPSSSPGRGRKSSKSEVLASATAPERMRGGTAAAMIEINRPFGPPGGGVQFVFT